MPTVPTKPKPLYLKWNDVLRITREAGLTSHSAIKLFKRDCPARIVLQNHTYPVYIRAEVLKALGIAD